MASLLRPTVKDLMPVPEGSANDHPPAGGELKQGHVTTTLFHIEMTAVTIWPA